MSEIRLTPEEVEQIHVSMARAELAIDKANLEIKRIYDIMHVAIGRHLKEDG